MQYTKEYPKVLKLHATNYKGKLDIRDSLLSFAAITLCVAFQKVFVCLCAISEFVMADLEEKHSCFKFCLKLGNTAAETYRTAVGDNAVGRTRRLQTFGWVSRFKHGQPSVAGCFDCYDIFVKNLFVQAKRLAGITIAIFCKVWRSKSCENCWKNGGTGTGWLTVTMRRRTVLCQRSSFCLPHPWMCSTLPNPPN